MKRETAEAVADRLDSDCIEYELRHDYSGRGMYGETTSALVVKDPQDVVYALGYLKLNGRTRTDNMGLDYVVY